MFISLVLISNLACNNSTHLDSLVYDSKEERIEVLKREVKCYSDFTNVEFDLFNVNGFSNNNTFLPGSSSWDYKFVIKVDTVDIKYWLKDMIRIHPDDFNFDWTYKLIKLREVEWETKSNPEFYKRLESHVFVMVHRYEGILYKPIFKE